jgi:hypothetical protein
MDLSNLVVAVRFGQVPVGDMLEHALRLARGRQQHDQLAIAVEAVAAERILRLDQAVAARQIFRRHQRDNAGTGLQRPVHLVDEILVGEVPLLQHHLVALSLKELADPCGQVDILRMLASPADKENLSRRCRGNRIHQHPLKQCRIITPPPALGKCRQVPRQAVVASARIS